MKFEVYQDKAGEFRWRLVAANGKTVADSGEGYVSRSNAHRAIATFQGSVATAPIVDE